MKRQIRLVLAVMLLAVMSSPGHGWAAKAQECWWCSGQELDPYEYCGMWYYKHAYMGMAGAFEGPAHPEYRCGLCNIEHNVCDNSYAAAVQDLNEALAQGTAIGSVLERHTRFVRLDRAEGRLLVRDCKGAVTRTVALDARQIATTTTEE